MTNVINYKLIQRSLNNSSPRRNPDRISRKRFNGFQLDTLLAWTESEDVPIHSTTVINWHVTMQVTRLIYISVRIGDRFTRLNLFWKNMFETWKRVILNSPFVKRLSTPLIRAQLFWISAAFSHLSKYYYSPPSISYAMNRKCRAEGNKTSEKKKKKRKGNPSSSQHVARNIISNTFRPNVGTK